MSDNKMTPFPLELKLKGNFIFADNDITIVEIFGSNKTERWQAIVTAVNSTYGKNINPESVPDLLEALKGIVAREEKAYAGRKQSADHFNNNTPGVGIKFDYETAAAMPKWISEAKAALAKAQLH